MSAFSSEFSKITSEIEHSKYLNQMRNIQELSHDRPVILYGAGKAVGIALVAFNLAHIEIAALCDSNKTGIYHVADVPLPIISPEKLLNEYNDAVLIITSWRFEAEIRKNLSGLGFDNDRIFSLWLPQRVNIDIFKQEYLSGYEWAYHYYQDAKSKQLVLDRARSYLTSEIMVPNTKSKTYYDSAFAFTDKEIFLDGGAYDGDTINDFAKTVNYKYKHIFAFEPDGSSFSRLSEAAKNIPNVKIFNVGLGEADGAASLHFNGLVASGFAPMKYFISPQDKFSDTKFETEQKEIIKIDSFYENNPNEPLPTFIKLDVEGWEAEVLHGAAATIKKSKPKLAVCVYHKIENVYDIPQTILNIRDDYKFKLRQCDYGYYETVLYAY